MKILIPFFIVIGLGITSVLAPASSNAKREAADLPRTMQDSGGASCTPATPAPSVPPQ